MLRKGESITPQFSSVHCVDRVPSKECSREKGNKRVTLQWGNLTNTTSVRSIPKLYIMLTVCSLDTM